MDAVRVDFVEHCDQIQRNKQGQHPYAQAGTGDSIYDELAEDGIEIDPDEKVRTIAFNVPGDDNPFTILATARDEKWRIVERLLAFEPNDLHLQYGYDAGGRLNKVWEGDRLVEQYQYGEQGERLVSETLHSERIHYEYDDKLRLLQAGDTIYTYNAYGSLSEKKVKNRVTQYEYLSNGQLCKVTLPDGRIIEYVCDKRGVRIAKKINGKIVEKYKWKDFSTLEAVTDSKGKNKITFTRDEESGQIVMTSEGKKFSLAVYQVGSIFMVADDQGNEVKRIIYDSFGNVLVDTNEQFSLPLGFASGLTDKDTGLVHFSFREYDPEIGRFTAQDPLGHGGGDVDVYGYCLDDPINFHDPLGLEAGGIWGTMPHRQNVKMWYIWKAGEGACDVCKKMDGELSETPTMKRPHPNCKCQQVECQTWDEYGEWFEGEKMKTLKYIMFSPIFYPGVVNVDVTWQRKYLVEEWRLEKHYKMLEGKIELLSTTKGFRSVIKRENRESTAHRIATNWGIQDGDKGWSTNPWTGETHWFDIKKKPTSNRDVSLRSMSSRA